MFLTQESLAVSGNQRGSALMAVLGVMAVTVVIGLTITVATINGLGVTSSNKASVQSRAAAAAGIDFAAAKLPGAALCPTLFPPAGTPVFSVIVDYLDASGNPVPSCATASQVKFTSTGQAQTSGLSGASSGDSSKIESIFAYTPASTPGPVPSGAAIYLASGANFNNGGTITSSTTVPAIQVKTGNFDCDNNTGIIGSVVVVTGTISLKKCTIAGDAWAFGAATLQTDGTVTGALTAALPKPASGYGTWAPGVPMPPVAKWTEFSYLKSDWVDVAGTVFDEVIKPATAGYCPLPQSNGTAPVIFNALNCAGVSDGGDVTLANDLVVVAKKFTFTNNLDFKSSTSAAHRVWFITPDLVSGDGVATCSAGQGAFSIGNNLNIQSPISAMLYTPCAISTGNGFVWRGQMYAGAINSWNNAIFGYVGVGLPGTNLTDGTYVPGGSAGSPAQLGALVSSRNID